MNQYFKFIDTNTLDKKLTADEFPFSQYLFWDTPIESIDIKKNKRYVVERVLTRGFLQDFTYSQKYTTQKK